MITTRSKYQCRGWTLPLLGSWTLELWVCPPHSRIPMHIHPDVDSHILHIWGRVLVMKDLKIKQLPCFTFFRLFHIPKRMRHGFVGSSSWFVFLNVERWHIATKTSAALNLKET